MNGPCYSIRQFRDRDESIQSNDDEELETARREADSFSFGLKHKFTNTRLSKEKSMAIEGWYYLHTNGALIYKPDFDGVVADIRDSNFARGLWPCDPSDREGAWTILVEALAGGANTARVKELAAKWHCDDADAANYAGRIGAHIRMDGNAWCATLADFNNLQESPAGFGDTALEALAALAKELGYKPSTMWSVSFKALLQKSKSAEKTTVLQP